MFKNLSGIAYLGILTTIMAIGAIIYGNVDIQKDTSTNNVKVASFNYVPEETEITMELIGNYFLNDNYEKGSIPLTQKYLRESSEKFGDGKSLNVEGCKKVKSKKSNKEYNYCVKASFSAANEQNKETISKLEFTTTNKDYDIKKHNMDINKEGSKYFTINERDGLSVVRYESKIFTYLIFSPDFKKLKVMGSYGDKSNLSEELFFTIKLKSKK